MVKAIARKRARKWVRQVKGGLDAMVTDRSTSIVGYSVTYEVLEPTVLDVTDINDPVSTPRPARVLIAIDTVPTRKGVRRGRR